MILLKDNQYIVGDKKYPRVNDVLDQIVPVIYSNEEKKILGRKVHYLLAQWDWDKEIKKSPDIETLPYLTAWLKFKQDFRVRILDIEKSIVSKKYQVGGTPDRIAIWRKWKTIVEIKIGYLYPRAYIQTAGYDIIYNDNKPFKERVKRRLIVQLKPDGSYWLTECKDPSDRVIFFSGLSIYNWKKRFNLL